MYAFLYDFVYSLVTGLLTVLITDCSVGLTENKKALIAVTVLSIALIGAIRHVDKKQKVFFIGLPASLFAGFCLIIRSAGKMNILYDNVWAAEVFGIALGIFVLCRIMGKLIWIRRILALLMSVQAFWYMYMGMTLTKLAVALFYCFLMMCVAEEVQRKWVKAGNPDVKGHMVNTALMLIVVTAIICAIPAPDHPHEWKIARRLWEKTKDAFSEVALALFTDGEEYGAMGFSDRSSMIGELAAENSKVLEVTYGKTWDSQLYLRGASFDMFDGREWTEYHNAGRMTDFDVLEALCAVKKYDRGHINDYIRRNRITVKSLIRNTQYVFAPAKVDFTCYSLEELEFTQFDNAYYANKKVKKETEYSMSYYQINQNKEIFKDLLRNAEPINIKEWKNNLSDNGLEDYGTELRYEFFRDYDTKVHEDYTMTMEYDSEVENLLNQIVEGAETNYDKLERISKYLRSMTYSETPGEIPREVDNEAEFLHWMLIDNRCGYCAHYATAFTLLARHLGIPARYVQGYVANKNFDESVLVMASDAHAWSEAYIDNFGWVTFDATPGRKASAGWAVSEDNSKPAGTPSQQPLVTPEPVVTPEPAKEPVPDEAVIEEPEPVKTKIDVRLILIPIGSGLLFAVIYLVLARLIAAALYKKMDDDKKITYLCTKNMKFLSLAGAKINPGETLQEYAVRIKDTVPESVGDFISGYEVIIYSNRGKTTELVKKFELANTDLLKMLRHKKIRYRLFLW